MKQLVLLLTMALVAASLSAQTLNWTTFEALPDSMAKKEKQILVFFTADWCKFCKVQEQTTFKDPAIIAELNKNYYCLRMNTDDPNPITFFGEVYSKPAARGTHQFVELLAVHNNQLKLPTTAIIYNLELRAKLQGMQDAASLMGVFEQLKGK